MEFNTLLYRVPKCTSQHVKYVHTVSLLGDNENRNYVTSESYFHIYCFQSFILGTKYNLYVQRVGQLDMYCVHSWRQEKEASPEEPTFEMFIRADQS